MPTSREPWPHSPYERLVYIRDPAMREEALYGWGPTPSFPRPPRSPAAEERRAARRAETIKRVVQRVREHFAGRIAAVEAEKAQLVKEVRVLRAGRGAWEALPLSPAIRKDLEERREALDDLDRFWKESPAPTQELEDLRRMLFAEKRERLVVEEQTQALVEHHAQVVSTLERRLKQRETQLQDLLGGVGHRPAWNRRRSSATPPSPEASKEDEDTPHRLQPQPQQPPSPSPPSAAALLPQPANVRPLGKFGGLTEAELDPLTVARLRAYHSNLPPSPTSSEERDSWMARSPLQSPPSEEHIRDLEAFFEKIAKEMEHMSTKT